MSSSSRGKEGKERKEKPERRGLRDGETTRVSANGEGPGSQNVKRQRVSPRFSAASQQIQNQENSESEEEETALLDSIRSLVAKGNKRSSPAQQSEAPMKPTRRNNGSISVTLDSEVLACPFCFETFTMPVFQGSYGTELEVKKSVKFPWLSTILPMKYELRLLLVTVMFLEGKLECENGHTACSSCCSKLAHKCPSCLLPIGHIRCRAIEKVLESAKISCQNMKYGCKETVYYSKKGDHEKTCIYAPCSCPVSGCSFISSSEQLYSHLSSSHVGDMKQFEYNCSIPVSFIASEKFVVLQEEKEGVVFILNNALQLMGNVIMVSCIGPSSKGGYSYELSAKSEGNSLIFRSFTPCIQSRVDNPPSGRFLLVPGGFFGAGEQITLDLCIWRKDAYSSCVHCSNV
ncbi:unnamed protein product [Dovyalis caffra]|uniref:SIAH-type domain-containing protein n=1 Tax=Dovyalis caffra TaxID=77055 RepID=A0AAV1S0Q5_9ROSI|nr:unnamed protein product [Dovyalis caffra]